MSTSQKTDCGCGGSSPSPASKTACGCGGSSPTSAPKTACGCGGKGCGQCGHGSFARPRFFAGQLLTEEDLGLLEQYVVGKNRLRNRYLTGEGVVCGLEVLCPPCGGRQVRVRPGYALDCCGNDILVPCEVAVDVIEMIRQLRLRTLDGWDCGEPCLEEMPKQAPEQKQGQQQEQERPKDIREYTLVLRYTESFTDPVQPYATGDACGPDQGCQPTRIQEGYCLELRCAKGPAPLTDIRQRFWDCVGEMPNLERPAASPMSSGKVTRGKVQVEQDSSLGNQLCDYVNGIGAWLTDRLAHHANLTDCALRTQVACLRCDGKTPQPELEGLATEARDLALRFIVDCLCRAILPPCPPCDDLDVPLATIRVEGCEVVGICNLVRRLVPTAPNLRYWLPQLEETRSLLQTICCLFPKGGHVPTSASQMELLSKVLDSLKPSQAADEKKMSNGRTDLIDFIARALQGGVN